jgi:hypothetical protein
MRVNGKGDNARSGNAGVMGQSRGNILITVIVIENVTGIETGTGRAIESETEGTEIGTGRRMIDTENLVIGSERLVVDTVITISRQRNPRMDDPDVENTIHRLGDLMMIRTNVDVGHDHDLVPGQERGIGAENERGHHPTEITGESDHAQERPMVKKGKSTKIPLQYLNPDVHMYPATT